MLTADPRASIRLVNNVWVPKIGLGTFKAQGSDVREAVLSALTVGLKHIDTAAIYKHNETDIAKAIVSSGLPRSGVFITSKISPYQQGTDKATQACLDTLTNLRSEYVDLMLIHWPGVSKTDALSPRNAELRMQTWQVLEGFYRQGRVRAIGVSNYEVPHLEQLMASCTIPPMVNQIEVHPRFPNRHVRNYCAAAGIAVVAYASLGSGALLSHPAVLTVASRVHKTPAQVLLKWGLRQDCAVLPKSVHKEYIAQYSEDQLLCDWGPAEAHLGELDALDDGHKYCWNPCGIA